MSVQRTERLEVRVSPEEKAAIEAEAEREDVKVSDLLRQRALVGKVPARPPDLNPSDRDFIDRRSAQLEKEGLPAHNARILAAREANISGYRIGDVFHPPREMSDAKRRQLTVLREAFAKQFGGDAA